MNTLLVIIPDRLSVLLDKGEVTERYYNPGNLFKTVHLLLLNNDRPDASLVQKMVGDAELHLHSLPIPQKFFMKTLGWQPFLIKKFVRHAVNIAKSINPDLVRVHNNFLQGYIAKEIKKETGTPYIISLHGVWDRDPMQSLGKKESIIRVFRKNLEKSALKNSDAVIAVYKPIIRYAKQYGAKRVELIYNVVSNDLRPKKSYELHSPPTLITVNRQLAQKDPSNIIRAIKNVNCKYILIGQGPYHEPLKQLAHDIGVSDKVEFIKSLPNEELCKLYEECDLMVSHCDYWGISKTNIEAALAGLPLILNHHPIKPIEDCEGDWLHLCDNTPESYENSIRFYLDNKDAREKLGQRSLEYAGQYFDPDHMEQKTISLYKDVMKKGSK